MTIENVIDETPYVNELRDRFKGKMSDKMYDDDLLFQRFLRARNYNLNLSEKMLANHLLWRKEYDVDNVLSTFTIPEVARNYFTANLIGLDREGCPILYFHAGEVDPRGLLKCLTKHEIINIVIHMLERCIKILDLQSIKLKRPVTQITAIFNFKNLSIMSATHKGALEIISHLVRMYESNYPERLKISYVINASFTFTLVMAVLRPFITGNTFQKIHVYGKSGWLNYLLETVHPDVLPAFLGGNRTDPDGNPLCKTFISHGGLVPKEYYLYHDDRENSAFSHAPGVQHLLVSRLAKQQVRVEVAGQDPVLEWEFETKNRDIAFSVHYAGGRDPVEVVPKRRINTMTIETGLYKCKKPGPYILEFDNTYSWINSKEIHYRVAVVTEKCQKGL